MTAPRSPVRISDMLRKLVFPLLLGLLLPAIPASAQSRKTELKTPAGNQVGRTGILGHVHRVFVAHVDDGSPDLNLLRARADGGEERERRAELACEVVHAEVRAIEAQFFGGYRELDRLQNGIRRRAHLRVWRCCPVPEGKKADLFHARYLQGSLSKKR